MKLVKFILYFKEPRKIIVILPIIESCVADGALIDAPPPDPVLVRRHNLFILVEPVGKDLNFDFFSHLLLGIKTL